MKFDQDLCLNLQYDFGKMNSTLGSVVPLAMFKAAIGNQDLSYKMYLHLQELREPFLQGMQAKMASIKSEVKKHFALYELLLKVDYLHFLTI